MQRSFLCFAHGDEQGWEAICVDLDISVQADSFDQAKTLLNEALESYIQAACDEAPDVRDKMLSRRAPWYVSVGLRVKFIGYALFRGRQKEVQASFGLPCHA